MELIGLTRCQSYTPGSTVGRVVYHSMAAEAGAAVDVSAVFAVTLAACQQQQQRSMAVWNLIMDGYDDDTELDAENDESTREIKRRRVYQRKDYKTSGWWQELQDEDLSDHTSRAARYFRDDFRVSYCFFEELVALVQQRDWFPTAKKDAVGSACIPVKLKVSTRNDGEKWPKLCCVDDILPTAVVVLLLLYSVVLVLF